MAKTSGSAVLPDGSYDKKLSRQFLKDIERKLDEMESDKGAYMARRKSALEQISKIYDCASDAGIPKKILKIHVKRRELENRLEALVDFADEEDTTKYQQLGLALDDGDAATGEPKKKAKGGMPGAEAPATH